jgi:hypothetical protein
MIRRVARQDMSISAYLDGTSGMAVRSAWKRASSAHISWVRPVGFFERNTRPARIVWRSA